MAQLIVARPAALLGPALLGPALLRAALLGMALLGVSGCTLIDQRFFDPAAGQPPLRPKPPVPPAPLAPPLPGPPPLLSIRLPAGDDGRAAIAAAVAAARARKPGVTFDVVEITPGTQAGPEAAAVAQAIVAQGVPAGRVNLSARPIAGVAHEIRVFVR